jgi:uncharacterized phage-associated protein
MVVSAHDVADLVRARLGDVGTLKLHKLLYFMQGWHMAAYGGPLFREELRAWEMGPVVSDLWADEKYGRSRPAPVSLHDDDLATVDYILDRYGRLTGGDLMRLTHADGPWRDVFDRRESDDIIPVSSLATHFAEDEDLVRHTRTVEQLRARRDIYSFDRAALTPALAEAVDRALSR